MNEAPATSRRSWRFPAAALIILLPGLVVAGTIVADQLGYCVSGILPGGDGLSARPYVQNVQPDEATILWRSTTGRPAVIRYGQPESSPIELELPEAERQEVTLSGLEPGTGYDYEVEWGSQTAGGSITTAPGDAATVRLAVFGDSGTGSSAQHDVAEQVEAADPDFVLHTGDIVYRRGALCHYGPKYFAPYETLIDSVPVYPAPGNHDLMASGGEAYFETFSLPVNNEHETELYYSFDYGPVHVTVLNSEFYAQDQVEEIAGQRDWLERDLADNALPWSVVLLHRPLYSSNEDKANIEIRDDLGPIFAEGRVDLVLAGHAHNYERFQPIDGVTYVVTGGGGARLHGIDPGPETAVAISAHHFVQIDASPDELAGVAIDRADNEIDRFTLVVKASAGRQSAHPIATTGGRLADANRRGQANRVA